MNINENSENSNSMNDSCREAMEALMHAMHDEKLTAALGALMLQEESELAPAYTAGDAGLMECQELANQLSKKCGERGVPAVIAMVPAVSKGTFMARVQVCTGSRKHWIVRQLRQLGDLIGLLSHEPVRAHVSAVVCAARAYEEALKDLGAVADGSVSGACKGVEDFDAMRDQMEQEALDKRQALRQKREDAEEKNKEDNNE